MPVTTPLTPDTIVADTLAAGTGMQGAPHTPSGSAAAPVWLFGTSANGTATLNGTPLFDPPIAQQLRTTPAQMPRGEQGEAGEALPFSFRSDDFVTSVLLVCCFVIAWIIAGSRHYLAEAFRNLLHPQLTHSLFASQEQARMRGSWLLLFHTAFASGILLTSYVQECLPALFSAYSPYMLLGAATLVCLALPVVKLGAYSVVNNVFFDRATIAARHDSYLLSVLCIGTLLYPVALLVVFFDLPPDVTIWCVSVPFVLSKALLLKSFRTFSSATAQNFHNFLYFCTLEILPLFTLWAVARAYII